MSELDDMDDMSCDEFAGVAAELALGVLTGRERAAALAHLDGCESCREQVRELTMAQDELLALLPSAEPPAGFESRVLERIGLTAPGQSADDHNQQLPDLPGQPPSVSRADRTGRTDRAADRADRADRTDRAGQRADRPNRPGNRPPNQPNQPGQPASRPSGLPRNDPQPPPAGGRRGSGRADRRRRRLGAARRHRARRVFLPDRAQHRRARHQRSPDRRPGLRLQPQPVVDVHVGEHGRPGQRHCDVPAGDGQRAFRRTSGSSAWTTATAPGAAAPTRPARRHRRRPPAERERRRPGHRDLPVAPADNAKKHPQKTVSTARAWSCRARSAPSRSWSGCSARPAR